MQDIKNYTMIICFLVFSIFNEYLFYSINPIVIFYEAFKKSLLIR